ncbi:hypothetical protein MTR_7g091670 [Medicago truncatula]|uniref:Uncharacterized protein n=1 Tax=Medicago truncatula TaxID=3880 RepID=A0A072U1S7_MEDTR|nr:hypothetical protein MTR_7g091670 [Medicago truncatula]
MHIHMNIIEEKIPRNINILNGVNENCDTSVKSLTSDKTWPDNVFISGGNPHLTSRFCGVVLVPTTISKMLSEPLQDPLGHLLSGFRYRTTHHLCPRTKPNSAGREGALVLRRQYIQTFRVPPLPPHRKPIGCE